MTALREEATYWDGRLRILRSTLQADARGNFQELWRRADHAILGLPPFVQENQSISKQGVLRGLHYQHSPPMGKLLRVTQGRIYLAMVDLTPGAGYRWTSLELEADGQQVYAAPGIAWGFYVLTEQAIVSYRCTQVYTPEGEGRLRWDDPQIGIRWPSTRILLSVQDAEAPLLLQALAVVGMG